MELVGRGISKLLMPAAWLLPTTKCMQGRNRPIPLTDRSLLRRQPKFLSINRRYPRKLWAPRALSARNRLIRVWLAMSNVSGLASPRLIVRLSLSTLSCSLR